MGRGAQRERSPCPSTRVIFNCLAVDVNAKRARRVGYPPRPLALCQETTKAPTAGHLRMRWPVIGAFDRQTKPTQSASVNAGANSRCQKPANSPPAAGIDRASRPRINRSSNPLRMVVPPGDVIGFLSAQETHYPLGKGDNHTSEGRLWGEKRGGGIPRGSSPATLLFRSACLAIRLWSGERERKSVESAPVWSKKPEKGLTPDMPSGILAVH